VSAPTLDTLVGLASGRLDADDFPTDLDLAQTRIVTTSRGAIVLADTEGATADSTSAALKALVQLSGPDGRSFAVLGPLDVEPADSRDEHDRIGRLVVRLNVHQLVVVGHEARHIHNAAGLEGSWDGESRLVATADEAYDLLREELRSGDVVLVKSSVDDGLQAGLDALVEHRPGDAA
jgi:UDP-N-acetylmuramoyl-tripeptide--D-alanyl-D-alanine ligase